MSINIAIQRIVIVIALAILFAILVSKLQMIGVALLYAIPILFIFLFILFSHPKRCLDLALISGFVAIGATRYIQNLPLGLIVDFALILTMLSALFHTKIKTDFRLLNNPLLWICSAWMLYCIFEIVNPEARSFAAWFYAVRGIGLYMILVVPLTQLYANKPEDLDRFIKLVFLFSFLAALWGYKQFYIGPDAAEKAWLEAGAKKTHILFGQLRIFSFFSDAGQFGAGMGQSAVIASILAVGPFSRKTKIICTILAVIFFHQMMISGTRGALFVPIGGFMSYFVASKKIKVMLIGGLVLGGVFGFLKYTTIANNNNQVRRMRSAFNSDDASLNVRKENQRKFAIYLAHRPFGGGIGTSGSWGQRFSPGSFLAETPNDSWYVKIWAETGIVGLFLHIGSILLIAVLSVLKIWKVHDPQLRQKLLALFAGFIGVALASYGNPIFGQLPQGTIIYMSWVYLFLATDLEKKLQTNTL